MVLRGYNSTVLMQYRKKQASSVVQVQITELQELLTRERSQNVSASVELKVMAHRRGQKVIVYKMRPKKKTRRKNGHRQELTRVMVESISVGGKAIS